MTKRLGRILAVCLFTAAALARAGADEGDPGKFTGKVESRKHVCMLQDSMQSRDGLEHEHQGKKYYLCCEGCVKGFDKDPQRYSRASDPVNGNSVDKADAPIYAYKGRAYFFSSEKNLAAFAADPEKYLGKTASSAAP